MKKEPKTIEEKQERCYHKKGVYLHNGLRCVECDKSLLWASNHDLGEVEASLKRLRINQRLFLIKSKKLRKVQKSLSSRLI